MKRQIALLFLASFVLFTSLASSSDSAETILQLDAERQEIVDPAADPLIDTIVDERNEEDLSSEYRSYEAEDLIAQQAMAEASEDLVEISRWQSYLELAGTVLLVVTVGFSAVAAWTSLRAARAAERTLYSERAWLTMEDYRPSDILGPDFDPIYGGYYIDLIWRNTGRSPAINAELYVEWRLMNLQDEIPTFTVPPDSVAFQAVIGPGSAVTPTRILLNGPEKLAWKLRQIKLVVFSAASYNDIFSNERRRSMYCAIAKFDGVVNLGAISTGDYVILSPTGPQNSAN